MSDSKQVAAAASEAPTAAAASSSSDPAANAAAANAAASQPAAAAAAGGTAQVQAWRPTTFVKAEKKIHSVDDVAKFPSSEGGTEVLGFIMAVNDAVRGRPCSVKRQPSAVVQAIVAFLVSAKGWVDEIPPVKQSMRFGNTAFRTWLQRLQQEAPAFWQTVLPADVLKASGADELNVYLLESFGNQTRIDYGSGHELNFVALLAALGKLGVLAPTAAERLCVAFDVFTAYLSVTRTLQSVYWLEPAGSKGVWGLDDYQFLPFLWGSAQLIGQDEFQPSAVHNDDVVSSNSQDYLYFGAVKFIRQMKKGLFAETSPILDQISRVPSWSKVNAGLIKMYHGEVLGKFPHFYFGSVLNWESVPTHPRITEALQRRSQNVAGAPTAAGGVGPWANARALSAAAAMPDSASFAMAATRAPFASSAGGADDPRAIRLAQLQAAKAKAAEGQKSADLPPSSK